MFRGHVVGDEQVGPAVVGEVGEHRPVTEIPAAGHSSLLGYVREAPVPLVAEEDVRLRYHPPGAAQDVVGLPDAGNRRLVVEGEIDVVRHVQIEVPVAVVIAEGAGSAVPFVADAGLFGDVGEAPVSQVPVEGVAAEVGDVEIEVSVVVVVGRGAAERPAGIADGGVGGHLGEGTAVVAVQPVVGMFSFGEAVEARAVGDVQVDVPVVVVVEESGAADRGLDDVLLVPAGDGGRHQADLRGDVDELHLRRRGSRSRAGGLAEERRTEPTEKQARQESGPIWRPERDGSADGFQTCQRFVDTVGKETGALRAGTGPALEQGYQTASPDGLNLGTGNEKHQWRVSGSPPISTGAWCAGSRCWPRPGRLAVEWDGRDGTGERVLPGIYLSVRRQRHREGQRAAGHGRSGLLIGPNLSARPCPGSRGRRP